MEYLQYFISFWLILILLLSFVKLKVGVSLFLLYMICVPFVMINIGDKTLGVNVINTTFLVSAGDLNDIRKTEFYYVG